MVGGGKLTQRGPLDHYFRKPNSYFSCASRNLVNTLNNINSQEEGKFLVILILSNEYEESDIELFKSQRHADNSVLISDEVSSRDWEEIDKICMIKREK